MNNSLKIGIIGGIMTIIIMLSGFILIQNTEQSNTIPLVEQSIGKNQPMKIEITTQEYDELRYINEENAVVIFPIFTGFIYQENGFYDYYDGDCDESCLTVKIGDELPLQYASSQQGFMLLQLLEYPYLTDIDISKNPDILKNYDKIIMLHNEYVTQDEFDAVTNHPNVVYLYPNSLYAKVSYDENLRTISLIQGHGYPNGIDNGFYWKFDNTRPYESDVECENWQFYEIENGHMLNCYPENIITKKIDIIRTMKKF